MSIKVQKPGMFDAPPGAVIFDTDNTLYHYDPAHREALAATRDKASRLLGSSPEQFDALYAEARDDVKRRLAGTASSHSRLLYFQRLLELVGLRAQVLLALDFEQTYWRVFLQHARLFEGVKDLLDDLRIADIRTAIVTDLTAQIQFRKIVYFDLDQYFDVIVTSEEAGRDKPDVAPFQLAMQKFGEVQGPLWMIGDHPVHDVAGAREAIGAVTLQKKHDGVTVGTGAEAADLVFESFTELRAFLAPLVARAGSAAAQ